MAVEGVGEDTSPAFEVYLGPGFVSPAAGGIGAAVSPAFALYLGAGFGQPISGIGAASSGAFALYLGLLSEGYAVSPAFLLDTGGTPCTLPTTPTGLTVTNLGTGTSLKVSWGAVPGATGYELQRSDGFGRSQTGTEYEDTGLTRNTPYTYTVMAVNACGVGPPSGPVSRAPDYYPVLLVHGGCSGPEVFTDCNLTPSALQEVTGGSSTSNRLGDWLQRDGFRVYVVRYDRAAGLLSQVPVIASAVRTVHDATNDVVVVVGHSEGGLLSRALLKSDGNTRSLVAKLITLATPHHGFFLAHVGIGVGPCVLSADAKQDMIPGSRFLNWLNYDDATAPYDRWSLVPCSQRHPEILAPDIPEWCIAGTGSCLVGGESCTPNDGLVTTWSALLESVPESHKSTDLALPGGTAYPPAKHYGSYIGMFCGSPAPVDILQHGNVTITVSRIAKYDSFSAPQSALTALRATTQAAAPMGSADAAALMPIEESESVLAPSATRIDSVFVDVSSTLAAVQGALEGNFAFRLITPSGDVLTSASNGVGGVTYESDDASHVQAFLIERPEVGRWMLESVAPATLLTPTMSGTRAFIRSTIGVSVQVGDTTYADRLAKVVRVGPIGRSLAGGSVDAIVIHSDGTTETLPMYDDGQHGDLAPGDGVFGGIYVSAQAGVFDINALATFPGSTPDAPIRRSAQTTFAVEAASDLAISPADLTVTRATSTSGDTLVLTAVVHNLGAVTAPSAIVTVSSRRYGLIGAIPISVPAFQASTANIRWVPAGPGADTIQVSVDANYAFVEDRYDNNVASMAIVPEAVGVRDLHGKAFSLAAMPNPSSGAITLRFSLPQPCRTTIRIFDVAGRTVARLVDGEVGSGEHELLWDPSVERPAGHGSGVYFCELRSCSGRTVRRVVIVR